MLEGTKVAIQGCGNVGGNTARIFGHRGAVVVAISDVSGGIYKETGLDADKVTAYVEAGGLLADYQEDGVIHISNTDILTCDCDVLVPAALENQITKEVAEKLKCSYIVEGANGPTAADADPNVITPVDALKELEKEGVFGSLHPYFYTTVGTGTTQAEAERMAKEIIPYLKEDGVDGVIMVST